MNRFIESTHQYFNGELEYLSVTTFTGKYQRPFNSSMVAHMSAKRSGETKEHYLNLWDLKRDIAIDYGNSIHKAVELWIKYQIKPTQPHLLLAVNKFIEQFGHIEWESEVRLYNSKYELGGTVDLLSDGIIADIKTNDTLKIEKKGNFIKPLNKVKVNNLNKVRLQTQVYEMMLGKEMQKLVYMWNGEEFEVIELESIDVSEILQERLIEIM
tara:strand:- start:3 stop:638 length:636 start_codon:yes stop_codon:yes gene_type:complete